MTDYKIADWWKYTDNGKILCTLCPRYCVLSEGQNGFCYVRKNIDNKLYAISYGKPTGFGLDPIEKKPLNHFLPGTEVLSFGTAGCNLGCKFCQNWSMSKAKIDDVNSRSAAPEAVIKIAKKYNTPSIAFTYNDPTIFGEYVVDVSKLAKEENIKSVMVTAGYIDKAARRDVYKYIDAANVDLKAFSENFYYKLTSSHLEDVLDTLIWIKNETDVWLEITTLLIPGKNDSEEEIKRMCNWIINTLGDETPIHFTAFHPDFKMTDIQATPSSTLTLARNIAIKEGAKYCYIGNVHNPTEQTTYCPSCHTPLIERNWHQVKSNIIDNGICPSCNYNIAGIFN